MEKTEIIYELYFKEAKTLTEISELVNTSISYISKVLKKDKRYETIFRQRSICKVKK